MIVAILRRGSFASNVAKRRYEEMSAGGDRVTGATSWLGETAPICQIDQSRAVTGVVMMRLLALVDRCPQCFRTPRAPVMSVISD
jgi:hypothetical protein